MEGNDCYKFSTVNRYLAATGGKPVELVLDVGCNLGEMSAEMKERFPQARIFAFEPLPEYYDRSAERFARDPRVTVLNLAVCGLHQFHDDFGERRRDEPAGLELHKSLEYVGASAVFEADTPPHSSRIKLEAPCAALSLDAVVAMALAETGRGEIDYLKMDCEYCEHHSLGCARPETLRRIRFIGGEYHGVERFHRVMKARLFPTHYVNLVGNRHQGSFFCERIGEERTMLRTDRDGMLVERPELSDSPIDWHAFREEFVAREEWGSHGLE